MRYVTVMLHLILATTCIGIAIGLAGEPELRPAYQYGFNGFTIGVCITAFIRALALAVTQPNKS